MVFVGVCSKWLRHYFWTGANGNKSRKKLGQRMASTTVTGGSARGVGVGKDKTIWLTTAAVKINFRVKRVIR